MSLAPKISLATLSSGCGTTRVARMIPNAPSIIGQGYNPIAFGPGCDAGVRAALSTFVAPWGQAPEVAEEHLEAYAILTGMGPTYFWYQWDALREVVRGLGLGHADVDAALRAMVSGSLATLLDSGLTPASVMDLVPVKPLGGPGTGLESGVSRGAPGAPRQDPASPCGGGGKVTDAGARRPRPASSPRPTPRAESGRGPAP